MKILRIASMSVIGILATVGLSYPASATTANPCGSDSDFAGYTVTVPDDGYTVYWSDSPLHIKDLCGDTLELDEVFFSHAVQDETSWKDTFSRDAFDEFGRFYFTDFITEEEFLADSWSFADSTVTSVMSFTNVNDTLEITGTFGQEGNTLTWAVDTTRDGEPFNEIEFGISGDLGSDSHTLITSVTDDVWVTHDENYRSDPILVWKSVGATLDWNPEPGSNDEVWFEWPDDGSVQLQVILVPNYQCYTGELDDEGDPVEADDQESFDEALDFALNTVAQDFDTYAGEVIEPFGDSTCAVELADTGVDVAPIGGAAAFAIVTGAFIAVTRRRRA
jgi:hypothetical protein